MAGLAHRAAVVSFARLCNQGLALLSPIILVRLLPVTEFGAYRRFYLYFTLVSVLAGMSINSSLLYFVPRHAEAAWALVRRCAGLVAVLSALAAALVFGADLASGGRLIGERVDQVLIYMLVFVNLDFWEHLALARKRPMAVLGYTVGRLLARMTTVIVTAALTKDVGAIITALIAVEAVRIVLAAIAWRWMANEESERAPAASAREILKYALPIGLAVLILTANRQTGGLVIDRFIGEVGLAYFAVGGYVYFIVTTLRNSISDVLLPEMSKSTQTADGTAIRLWQRSVVVFSILLLPTALVLGCFSELVITTVFSAHYLPAVPVFQVYLLVLIRECFDFDLGFRSVSKTRDALGGHAMTFVVNVSLALILVPTLGIVGAALSLVASRALAGVYLTRRLAEVWNMSPGALIPWRDLSRVWAAVLVAGTALLPAVLRPHYEWFVIIPCSVIFAVLFLFMLRIFDVAEARWLSALIGRRLGLQHS